ncbi:MAG: ABC transporter ATP-binding protein [Clostridia bacterium]|nr:ABC transporter ATP-binding protein [Clostridia bacterium]MDE6869659.1 ABC transporter ATP-binding protein [Clostridia bacterium]
MRLVEINDVSKIYKPRGRKKGLPVTAVSHATLDVEEGEILGLLGANGAGKTTLIKLMLGLVNSDGGSITIGGFDVATSREKALAQVGAIVEAPTLFNDFSGMDNLKYYARLQGGNISEEKLKSIVSLVGLEDRIHDKFKTYSLGMRQRLGIAQAIMHSPKLLLLDEPTNGLDPDGIAQMRDLFINLKKQMGTTIIISSHILGEMQQTCDRVAFMAKGEIKAVKSMEEVNYGVDSMRKFAIECSDLQRASQLIAMQGIEASAQNNAIVVIVDQAQVGELVKTLVENDIVVYTVNKLKRSLEDLYREVSNGEAENRYKEVSE